MKELKYLVLALIMLFISALVLYFSIKLPQYDMIPPKNIQLVTSFLPIIGAVMFACALLLFSLVFVQNRWMAKSK
jgi:polyferredoxin